MTTTSQRMPISTSLPPCEPLPPRAPALPVVDVATSSLSAPAVRMWGRRLAMIFCLLGLLALVIDDSVYSLRIVKSYPRFTRVVFPWIEIFGHGLGVVLVSCLVFLADRSRRHRILPLVCCALVAGITCNLVKPVTFRMRPREATQTAYSTWETFRGPRTWWNATDPRIMFDRRFHSCPSGHTASAAALATVLAWYYPRGRYGFVLLAMLVAFQRISVGAHFYSDTFFGAALGCGVASFVLSLPVWSRTAQLASRLARL